jgi:hypothetical protein
MLCSVVWKKGTDVSEVFTTSISGHGRDRAFQKTAIFNFEPDLHVLLTVHVKWNRYEEP